MDKSRPVIWHECPKCHARQGVYVERATVAHKCPQVGRLVTFKVLEVAR